MIYTSYFAKLKKLPEDIIPISICGKAPDWYKGIQYKILAPKYGFFKQYKDMIDNSIDKSGLYGANYFPALEEKRIQAEDYYIEHFQKEVLNVLDAKQIVYELYKLSQSKDIALICYERPSDFCHRHLVHEWLVKNGCNCWEYEF